MLRQLALDFTMPIQEKEDVAKVIKYYTHKCKECSLGLKSPDNYGLLWRGNPQAMVAFVGIMPADAEWEQGRAMAGDSGKLLDKWGRLIGVNTNANCFMINIVQCITPRVKTPKTSGKGELRPPDIEEITVCFPRCLRVLRAMPNLKVVGLLGEVVRKTFVGTEIGGQGDWLTNDRLLPGVLLFCMPHPAGVLRDASDEKYANAERLLGHLKVVLDKIKKGEPV